MERVARLAAHLASASAARGSGETAALSAHETSGSAPTPREVLTRVEDGVGVVTLSRPARGNAFTAQMQAEYFDALDAMDANPAVTAVVVTGAGKQFCVGADMDMLSAGSKSSSGPTVASHRDVAQVRAAEMRKPLVCAVNGAAAGLGFVTAVMADVRFACKTAKFTTAFARRGLVAEHGVAWVLPRVVGQARALDLLMSSRVVLADEALAMGLVNFVSGDAESCVRDAVKYARDVGRLCSPAALAEIKRQVYAEPVSLRQDYARAADLMSRSFTHPDFAEGVASYVESRDPKFKGLAAGMIRDLARKA